MVLGGAGSTGLSPVAQSVWASAKLPRNTTPATRIAAHRILRRARFTFCHAISRPLAAQGSPEPYTPRASLSNVPLDEKMTGVPAGGSVQSIALMDEQLAANH